MQNEQRYKPNCLKCLYFSTHKGGWCKRLKVPVQNWDSCDKFKGRLLG